jgi:hypothetical protein
MNIQKPKRFSFLRLCVVYYLCLNLFTLIVLGFFAFESWLGVIYENKHWSVDETLIAYVFVIFIAIPQNFILLFVPIILVARLFGKLGFLYQKKVILGISLVMVAVVLWVNPLGWIHYLIESFSVGRPIDDQQQRDLIEAGFFQDNRKSSGRMES